MNASTKKHLHLYSPYSISNNTQNQQIMTVNCKNSKWSRLIAWITNTKESFHQVDSSLLMNDTTSELQLLSSKSSSNFSLAISQLSSTTPTSSLRVKIFNYFLFILTFIAVIIIAYQTGFYLVLLRNLQSTSSSTLSFYCKNDPQLYSEKQNGSQSVDSSHLLALYTVLREAEFSPQFPVDLTINLTDLTDKSQNGASSKCSHYSCFDIYRCGVANYQSLELQQQPSQSNHFNLNNGKRNKKTSYQTEHFNGRHHQHQQHIKVYVYPNYQYIDKKTGDLLLHSKQQQSIEFTRLIKAVIGSRYFTTSAARACLYVINLDLLNAAENVQNLKTIERILWSMPSFAALSGANHLLFSMLLPSNIAPLSSSSSSPTHVHPQLGINIGQAMVAAAGLRLSTYRDQFDVSLPGYSLFGQLYNFSNSNDSQELLHAFNSSAISSLPRRWTVISPQTYSLSTAVSAESLRYRLQQLEVTYPDEVLLLQSDCNADVDHSSYISPANPQVMRLFAHTGQHKDNSSNSNETLLFSKTAAHQLYTGTMLCNPERQIGGLYLDLLHSAEFCLILDSSSSSLSSASSWSLLLSDSLMSGCIPVLLADSLLMPLEAPLRIDWATASIRVWEHSAARLFDILSAIPARRRAQLRANGLAIWQSYFASIETIATTTLDLINERVYPAPRALFAPAFDSKAMERQHSKRDQDSLTLTSAGNSNHEHHRHHQPAPAAYRVLRQQSFDFFSIGGNHYIVGQEAALRSVGFTAVILSFNRPDSLMDVILSVSRAPSCAKILVVWNGDADLLQSGKGGSGSPLRWPTLKGGTPIQVVFAGSNRLSNRFYPYESIETEAVFSIDDDIGMLTADEIEFAYQTWRQFPNRIVGFPSRLHFWDNRTVFSSKIFSGNNRWTYDSEWRNEISLILTGAAFYHSYYNHLYTSVMPASIRDWVDQMMNCEDIAMNFLVSNITCAAPIKVTPRKKFKCPECSKPSPKLSADAIAHLQMRSRCIDYFAQIYGMMPLKAVEFRANPVLFRDNIPDKLKTFTMIGTL